MADKDLLEQLKKLFKESGLEAAELDRLIKGIEGSTDSVIKKLIEQQKSLKGNRDLLNETLEISVKQEQANSRITREVEEYNSSLEEAREILKRIKEYNENIFKLETELKVLQEKKKELGENLSQQEKDRLKDLETQIGSERRLLETQELLLDKVKQRRVHLLKEKELNEQIQNNLETKLTSLVGISNVWVNINEKASISSALFAQFAHNASELLATVNKGNADFAKTTGQIAERTIGFGYGLSQFGIGFQELNKASADLYVSMSQFSNLNSKVQLDLAESAAKMELLGVNSQTTGKILNDLTKGFRMTAQEASKANEYIARVAIGIGVAPSKMAADFTAAMPRLQAYGKQGVEVFAQLEKQAKSLGMEMNTLMGIVGDTFDTFEGGARAAGKLNAVLGGDYLNSVEMLNATESERIEILKRSFDMSGKSWDSLDKYEKKAVAATLGINDLNEASKIFGSSSAELTADMQKQAASQEKLEAVQREAVEVQKKMNEIFNAFLIIIRPLVAMIEGVVNVITRLNDAIPGLGSGILAVTSASMFFGIGLKDVAAKMGDVYNGTKNAISAIGEFFKSIGDKEKIKSFGDSVKEYGSSLKDAFTKGSEKASPAAAPGTELVEDLADKAKKGADIPDVDAGKAKTFKDYMKGIREGFDEFGANPAQTLKGALVFTLVAAAVGVSLAIFAYALKQFTGIDFEQVMKGLGVLTLLTLGMFALGFALSGPGALFFAAGIIGIVGLSVAIAFLGESLGKLDTTKLEAFTTFTDRVSQIKDIKDGADQTASAIRTIGEALTSIPDGKDVTLRALNDTLYTAKTVTEEEIKPAKQFIDSARQYYDAQQKSKDTDKDALVNALRELKSIMTPKQSNEPINVKLVLNDGQTLTGKMFGMNLNSGIVSGQGS